MVTAIDADVSARLPGLYACILIGGKSARMGKPKHLIEIDGESLIERLVCALRPFVKRTYISGAGSVPASLKYLPRLHDPAGMQGPIAGLCAAFRQHPRSAWLLSACDMPFVSASAVRWLIEKRRAKYDAVVPKNQQGDVEPLLAIYEPRLRSAVEDAAGRGFGPKSLVDRRCRCPRVPSRLAAAFKNVNTPEDLLKISFAASHMNTEASQKKR